MSDYGEVAILNALPTMTTHYNWQSFALFEEIDYVRTGLTSCLGFIDSKTLPVAKSNPLASWNEKTRQYECQWLIICNADKLSGTVNFYGLTRTTLSALLLDALSTIYNKYSCVAIYSRYSEVFPG